jgi:hypothetical protein
VILRAELVKLGSGSQVSRTLAKFVSTGLLARVGHGVYVKTRLNRFTGRLAPAATFESIVSETFKKLGVVVGPGKLLREYNSGRSTQIPMQTIITAGRRRIRRRIQVGCRTLAYESKTGRPRR